MIRDFRTFDWLSSVSSSEIMAKKNLGKDRARCPMTSAKNAKTKSGSFCNVTHKNPKSKTFKNFCNANLKTCGLFWWIGQVSYSIAWRVAELQIGAKKGLNAVSTWVSEAAAGILFPSGVRTFHRSDSSLLTSLVDSQSQSCVPFLHELWRGWSLVGRGTGKRSSRSASKFIDGAPHLAAGVREIDEIDSFFPLLLLLLCDPRMTGQSGSVRVSPRWDSEEGAMKGLALFVPPSHKVLATAMWDALLKRKYQALAKFLLLSRCLLYPEVAITQRIHLSEGKNAFHQLCESSNASTDRCRQTLTLGLCGVVREGRYCDCGNLPRTRLSGSRDQVRVGADFTSVREAGCYICSSQRLLVVDQESRLSLSGDVLL